MTTLSNVFAITLVAATLALPACSKKPAAPEQTDDPVVETNPLAEAHQTIPDGIDNDLSNQAISDNATSTASKTLDEVESQVAKANDATDAAIAAIEAANQ